MSDLRYEYVGQRFAPRAGSEQRLLLFVAPAGDIRSWAGVPRKAFDYQHGFQRTLNPDRVEDVARYFRDDVNNVSPTSVVVGFTSAVVVEPIGENKTADVGPVSVRISLPDLTRRAMNELADLAIEELRSRLPANVTASIDADVETAVAEAMRLQDEDAVDETFGIESEGGLDPESGGGVDPRAEDRSYLADFYAQLIGYRRKLIQWPDENQLREVLYSILKPAIIVDGQHRVFGGAAAEEDMRFAVCAISTTDRSMWAESVYQFVVINQKARPIKPAFLSSIIATSLSGEEIEGVFERLRTSRIDVNRAEMMERLNTEPTSPFRDMIDFEVERSPGFLQFPGMARLARDFQNAFRSHSNLLPDGGWKEVEGGWLAHFFAFWTGVRQRFEEADSRLWQSPSADNPNNLLKIVTLQEIQQLMLDNWADGRTFQFGAVQATEAAARRFWTDFPVTFFTDEWRKKGLQTSVGRRIVRDAIIETRRNAGRKNWGHRRLGLFSE